MARKLFDVGAGLAAVGLILTALNILVVVIPNIHVRLSPIACLWPVYVLGPAGIIMAASVLMMFFEDIGVDAEPKKRNPGEIFVGRQPTPEKRDRE